MNSAQFTDQTIEDFRQKREQDTNELKRIFSIDIEIQLYQLTRV